MSCGVRRSGRRPGTRKVTGVVGGINRALSSPTARMEIGVILHRIIGMYLTRDDDG